MDTNGTVPVVIGAASGLGYATAKALHDRGAGVVLLDLPSSDGMNSARTIGERAVSVPPDVTSCDDVTAAMDTAVGFGGLSIAVNCAGIGPVRKGTRAGCPSPA